jgi:hypothetical protein
MDTQTKVTLLDFAVQMAKHTSLGSQQSIGDEMRNNVISNYMALQNLIDPDKRDSKNT